MFNPNIVPAYSHRSQTFHEIFSDCREKFKDLAGLSAEDECIFITGSGTLANEIVINSLIGGIDVIGHGAFSDRLRALDAFYGRGGNKFSAKVYYETSTSTLNTVNTFFSDCVSAFPFYSFPNSRICTTVPFKQIGAISGMSIITVRDYDESLFCEETPSYLSLVKYVKKASMNETPNTPSISGMESMQNRLTYFTTGTNVIKERDRIRNSFNQVITALDNAGIPHTGVAPVVTITTENIPDKYKTILYKNSGQFQMFLWDSTEKDIDGFCEAIQHG